MKEIKFFAVCVFFCVFFLVLAVDVRSSENEGDYVGTEACMECHEEIYESFVKNLHGIEGDPRTPAAKLGCESCHGPGAVHAEKGESGDIFWPSADSPEPAEKKSDICLQCHTKGKVVLWQSSEHETRGLACTNCHSMHKENPRNLAKPTQTQVCITCHQEIRPQLLRQSHHPIREGKMKCTDCHNSHGTIADKLVEAQYVNLKCFECHAKNRGPYLWEHPPAVDDCLSCHKPHGSTHDFLLNAKSPYLCQRCHLNTIHTGINELQARSRGEARQSVYTALNNRAFYRGCLNCHNAVHGSNHPSGKALTR
ncbi:MAG: DmsE family decaheme c-type cytochrome [Desulfobacterales bacterium]|jgi:DmsE family decaheme c-type cytochrome|nr:DmsE family decaheme c-type cytochrome [Desulfobacterales bacterium]